MSETVDVIIAAYGDRDIWIPLAERAAKSVDNKARVIFQFGGNIDNLGSLRNSGAIRSDADWLIFLDADDELAPGYIEAMLSGTGDMRWPATLGFYDDGTEDAEIGHLAPNGASLIHHNWMVIGTMVRRDLFLEVGGFRDLPILEDWDLWIRMVLAGAKPESCFSAIYRINVRPDSRNNPGNHGQTYSEIQQRYQAEWNAKGLT